MVTVTEMMVIVGVSDCAIKGRLLPAGPEVLSLPSAVRRKGRRPWKISDVEFPEKSFRKNSRGSGVILLPPASVPEQASGSVKIYIKLTERNGRKAYELNDAARAFSKSPKVILDFARENDVKIACSGGKIFLERGSFREALVERGHIKPE
jgi:hypothetical protein